MAEMATALGRCLADCRLARGASLLTLLVHRTVYLYILRAPFAMADDMYNGLGIILPRDCQSAPPAPRRCCSLVYTLGPRAA